jgi:redox-sensitive bicupin YhaK (pirin superfamily)
MHRDSTGVVQRIEPGAVNWMSAGRGIVHSERTPKDLVGRPHRSHGLQLWIALPEALEDSAPSFQHVPAEAIPRVRIDGATARVVAGAAFGAASPVETASPTLAVVLDLDVASGTSIALPPGDATERALYALDHPIEVDGVRSTSERWSSSRRGRRPRSPRRAAAASSSSAASRSAIASCRGTSSRARASGSAPPRTTGSRSASRDPGRDRVHPASGAPPAPADDRTVPGAA